MKNMTNDFAAPRDEMADRQREISVSEFFTKNRHLLGFDNPRKALLTTVKEAVDNASTPARRPASCRRSRSRSTRSAEDRFRVTVEDNGPGIVESQIPQIFGKLLYGSKFHRLKMSRGQQGIGISRGRHVRPAHHRQAACRSSRAPARASRRTDCEMQIDTAEERARDRARRGRSSGSGRTARGSRSSWRRQLPEGPRSRSTSTSSRPPSPTRTCTIAYQRAATGEHDRLRARDRASCRREPREIKPHPHGVELGMLIKMLKDTQGADAVRRSCSDEFSPRRAAVARGDLRDGEARARAPEPARIAHAGGRDALQGDPADEDHGPADRLPRRRSARSCSWRACKKRDRGRLLHRRRRGRRRSTAATRSMIEVGRWPTAGELPAATSSRRACCASPTACRCSTSSRRCAITKAVLDATGATTACSSRAARCRSGRW